MTAPIEIANKAVVLAFVSMPAFAHPGPEEHRPIFVIDDVVEELEQIRDSAHVHIDPEVLPPAGLKALTLTDRIDKLDDDFKELRDLIPKDRPPPEGFIVFVTEYGPPATAGVAGGSLGWLLMKSAPAILKFVQGLFTRNGFPAPHSLNNPARQRRHPQEGRKEDAPNQGEGYFVNRNKNQKDGLHQVHKMSCYQVFVDEVNRVSLGRCASADEAVQKAIGMGFKPADGCGLCSPEAHRSH